MTALAHLNREEKLGLGIAVVAHIALLGGLLYQATRDQPLIAPAERMTVSLASDVSLESTAPDPSDAAQAAIAPVLASESAPLPAPASVPVERPAPPVVEREATRPRPAPTPIARATTPPKAQPRAQPSASRRSGGGSRLGDDFLEGTSSGDRSKAGTPAATFGPAESASLQQAIARQIKPHWSAPQGPDVEKLVTIVRFRLNKDGTLIGSPTIVSQSGVTPTNEAQKARHAEQAIRAVRLAAPFDLPEEFYDKWKTINSTFDRRL